MVSNHASGTRSGTTCTNDTERRAAVMAHVTTGFNRVTQIYEVELAISFTLIANTDQWTAGTTADTILPNTDQRDNMFRPILRVFPPSMTRIVPSQSRLQPRRRFG